MSINPGTTVPGDVQSSVQIANDLGEQVVNLVPDPRRDARRRCSSGADVPAAPDQVPANVGAGGRVGDPAAPGHSRPATSTS